MKTISLAVISLVAAVVAGQATAGASEDAIAAAVADYRANDVRGEWTGPLQQTKAASSVTAPSADQRLNSIVASHSRELLDRGGWVNSYLDNADYASRNPLLTVQVGDGCLTIG